MKLEVELYLTGVFSIEEDERTGEMIYHTQVDPVLELSEAEWNMIKGKKSLRLVLEEKGSTQLSDFVAGSQG